MWNLKYDTDQYTYGKKKKKTHRQKTDLWLSRGKIGGEGRIGS